MGGAMLSSRTPTVFPKLTNSSGCFGLGEGTATLGKVRLKNCLPYLSGRYFLYLKIWQVSVEHEEKI